MLFCGFIVCVCVCVCVLCLFAVRVSLPIIGITAPQARLLMSLVCLSACVSFGLLVCASLVHSVASFGVLLVVVALSLAFVLLKPFRCNCKNRHRGNRGFRSNINLW